MNRYLFQLSGHLEVMAENEDDARVQVLRRLSITYYDPISKVGIHAVPTSQLIHTEPEGLARFVEGEV